MMQQNERESISGQNTNSDSRVQIKRLMNLYVCLLDRSTYEWGLNMCWHHANYIHIYVCGGPFTIGHTLFESGRHRQNKENIYLI